MALEDANYYTYANIGIEEAVPTKEAYGYTYDNVLWIVDTINTQEGYAYGFENVGVLTIATQEGNSYGGENVGVVGALIDQVLPIPTEYWGVIGSGAQIEPIIDERLGGNAYGGEYVVENYDTIAFRDVAANTTSTAATLSVTIPATTQVGDLMVAFVAYAARTIPTPPAGWTQLRYDQAVETNNTDAYIYYRVAQGGDAGSAFTVTPSSAGRGAITLLAYSGVNVAAPFNQHAAQLSLNNTWTYTSPSVTTTLPYCMIVRAWAGTTSSNQPNSLSGVPPVVRSNQPCPGNFLAQASSEQAQAVAGSCGWVNVTSDSIAVGSFVGHTIALAPAVI